MSASATASTATESNRLYDRQPRAIRPPARHSPIPLLPTTPPSMQQMYKTSPIGTKTSPIGTSKISPIGTKTSPIGFKTSPIGFKTSPIGCKTSPIGFKTSPIALRTSSPIDLPAPQPRMQPIKAVPLLGGVLPAKARITTVADSCAQSCLQLFSNEFMDYLNQIS